MSVEKTRDLIVYPRQVGAILTVQGRGGAVRRCLWWQCCCSSRVGQVRITQLVLSENRFEENTQNLQSWDGVGTWSSAALSFHVCFPLQWPGSCSLSKENGVLCEEPGNHPLEFRGVPSRWGGGEGLTHRNGRHCQSFGFSKALDGIFSVMHY